MFSVSCRLLDQRKDTGKAISKTAISIVTSMKKHIQKFVSPKVEGRAAGLMPKYSLLAGDTSHVPIIFLLHKILMSQQLRFIL